MALASGLAWGSDLEGNGFDANIVFDKCDVLDLQQ
jgi:hypothetical protein